MKVLLAIDDSKFSDLATQAVIQHARPDVAEVCVLHVVPLASLIQAVREGRELITRVEEQLKKAGYKVSSTVEQGDPRETVIDYAKNWHADLIVVGSHGRTGLDRFLLGSVAESIARHSQCSVLIVRRRNT